MMPEGVSSSRFQVSSCALSVDFLKLTRVKNFRKGFLITKKSYFLVGNEE